MADVCKSLIVSAGQRKRNTIDVFISLGYFLVWVAFTGQVISLSRTPFKFLVLVLLGYNYCMLSVLMWVI